MEKILKDRLNTLKSRLADETHVKITKVINQYRVKELEIRISEVEWLLKKVKL